MVKVRFAPSPTGNLHIGGARTALFNWMYAKAQGGQFVLRVEDTDLERSKPEYEAEIMNSMAWLGLTWDEFYKQSDRFAIYKEQAEKLLGQGEEVAYKKDGAIFLNIKALSRRRPKQEIFVDDLIRGRVQFDLMFLYSEHEKDGVVSGEKELRDEVLVKSDGAPTYSFACVIDDAMMGITHVIRGEDHLTNTPKQVLMYEALGFGDKVPKFAHLPMIMGEDGTRMSKRHGATAVSDYRKMGFLPEALVNYLMLLGWSPGNEEILPLKNACTKFSIKKVNKSAAQFGMEKLRWINAQYIKKADVLTLTDLIVPMLKDAGLIGETYDRGRIEVAIGLFKGRMSTLPDFLERAGFLFTKDISLTDEMKAELAAKDMSAAFALLADRLAQATVFDIATTEKVFRDLVAELGIASGELVHPVRLALSASAIGPGLFETMAVLGKDLTVARLRSAYLK
ncbi:MAG: glutamate--tRNA ligase [Candidatus Omnitrophica bacterium]|nr:glutamate--tRNA ligase [Candidatus Omnitrophota bacterium]